MKAAILSFFITLSVLCIGFLLYLRAVDTAGERILVHEGKSLSERVTSQAPARSAPAQAPMPDANIIAALDTKARQITTEKPIVGNIVKWWNVICDIAERNPVRAIETVREAPKNFLGDTMHDISGTADSIVAWWAARDQVAALAWYWPDATQRRLNHHPPEEIIQTLARRSVVEAIRFTRRYLELQASQGGGASGYSTTSDGLRVKTTLNLSRTLSSLQPWLHNAEDFTALLPLVEVIPDPAQRAGFWQAMAATLISSQDISAARSFFDCHPFPADWPSDQTHPAAALVQKAILEQGDPNDWIEWGLRSIPDRPDLRSQMAAGVMKTWTVRNPEAAGRWLQSFCDSDATAAPVAMRAYACAAMEVDPAAAMAWITAIPDETIRRQNMILHFPKWAEKDAAAAGTWLATSDWPDVIKRLAGAAIRLGPGGE